MMYRNFAKRVANKVKYIFQFARMLDQVRESGLFLTGSFPLLLVPAAAGVMELGSQLMNLLLPAVLAIVPITALVMAVTGMVAQKCAGGKEHKNG